MMTKGRKPKPHHLKLIEGNPGKRKLEPPVKTPPSKPRRPSDLSPDAVTVWNRIVPRLDDLGVLAKIDAEMLALYCEHYARWREAADYSARGVLVASRHQDDPARKNPALQVMRDNAKILVQLSSLFGLTPVDRIRLHAGTTDPDAATALARILSGESS
jgi:P27 family predicted phage terminase small subunit